MVAELPEGVEVGNFVYNESDVNIRVNTHECCFR